MVRKGQLRASENRRYKMQKRKKIITYKNAAIVLLIFGLAGGAAVAGRIAVPADQVQTEDVQQDKSALEQQQEQVQKESDDLKNARKELQEALDSMDVELVDVSNEVSDLLDEIELTEEAIADAEEELARTEADAQEQYDSMKLRIQYMYENGGTFSWTSIFSAKSFTDALNRAEYALELATTDRLLLKRYGDTLQQIKEEKQALEEKRAGLLLANQELEEKKAALLATIETTQTDMEDTDAEIAGKEAALADIADQLAAMEEYERKLEEQKAKEAAEEQERIRAEEERLRKEEEERKKAEEEAARQEESDSADGGNAETGNADGDAGAGDTASSGDSSADGASQTGSDSTASTDSALRYYLHTTTPVSVSAEEEELFAALVYCEAGGESYETQLAVASVVVNRINSSRYPNSLVDVIYQKNQFSPASSGRLAVVLEKGLATESCRTAAREALAGNICGDWLNFCYNFGTINGLVIGSEVFYEL
jgi:spore germination cell wall hydrolase CwlJ-like protein